MIKQNAEFNKTIQLFEKLLLSTPFIGGIRNKKQYEEALAFIETLMIAMGDNPKDPRWPLFELVAQHVDDYELKTYPQLKSLSEQPATTAILRNLMDKHDLKQADLKEIGSQGVVSEVLNGKRELNIRQIRALCKRFKLDPALFV